MLIATYILFFCFGVNMGLSGTWSSQIGTVLSWACLGMLVANFTVDTDTGLQGLIAIPCAGVGYALSPRRR